MQPNKPNIVRIGSVPPPKTTRVNRTIASVVVISISALGPCNVIAKANAIAPRSPYQIRLQKDKNKQVKDTGKYRTYRA